MVAISGSGVAPYQVTFNNNAYNYTLQSTGGFGITGTTSLTMSGSGSVTMTGTNTYTGNTNLNAGTLIVSSVNSAAWAKRHDELQRRGAQVCQRREDRGDDQQRASVSRRRAER